MRATLDFLVRVFTKKSKNIQDFFQEYQEFLHWYWEIHKKALRSFKKIDFLETFFEFSKFISYT